MSYQQPYNPGYPPPGPYPTAPGYEQYQQGPPPPGYNPPPPQYSPYPQQQYGPPQPQYGPPPGTTVYTQQPSTVYVYENQKRRDTSGEECFLWGLCAACLCCCLMSD